MEPIELNVTASRRGRLIRLASAVIATLFSSVDSAAVAREDPSAIPIAGKTTKVMLVPGASVGALSESKATGGVLAIDFKGALFAAKSGNAIVVRGSELGRRLSTLPVPNATALDFSSDSHALAIGTAVGEVIIYSWGTGEQRLIHSGKSSVDLLRYAVGDHLLAIATNDGELKIIEVDTGVVKCHWMSDDRIDALAWLGSGDDKIAMLAHGRISIWEVGRHTAIDTIDTGPDVPSAMAVGPTRKWVAWGSRSGAVVLKNLSSGVSTRLREPDASFIFSMTVIDENELWIGTGEAVEVIRTGDAHGTRVLGIDGLNFLFGGRKLVGMFDFGTESVRLLRPSQLGIGIAAPPEWRGRGILEIGARTGEIVTVVQGGRAEHWSTIDHQMRSVVLPNSSGRLTISADGTVAAANASEGFRILNTRDGSVLGSVRRTEGSRALRFSPDNQRLFAWLPLSGLGEWEWKGDEMKVLYASKRLIIDIAQTTDGERIITGDVGGELTCLDSQGSVKSSAAVGGEITRVAVTGDGSAIAGCVDGELVRWSAITGEALVRTNAHLGRVRRIVVDPKGGWVASIAEDRRLRLSSPTTLSLLDVAEVDGDPISLASDGRSLWVGCMDGVAREYRVEYRVR